MNPSKLAHQMLASRITGPSSSRCNHIVVMPPLPTPHQAMISQMLCLLETFSLHVDDRSTLDELHRMVGDEKKWCKAHDLFDRIRDKTLVADVSDPVAAIQYSFEEACAKTLFNLTDTDAPFDPDAPYWVVPDALCLAENLGILDEVIRIVAT